VKIAYKAVAVIFLFTLVSGWAESQLVPAEQTSAGHHSHPQKAAPNQEMDHMQMPGMHQHEMKMDEKPKTFIE